MSKFGCLVMGPAGAGKSTFCSALIQHLRHCKRSCVYVNLDPAAEDFTYEPDIDIKELISVEDAMEELELGPNGGLMACFEHLIENLDWLTDKLEDVSEEYLIIIDMPGQIELYTHVPVVPQLVKTLTRGSLNISMCAAYLLESTFVIDQAKFFAGTLSAMSAMLLVELPHVNILSKMDLVKGQVSRKELRRYIDPSADLLDDEVGTDGALKLPGDEVGDRESTESIMKGSSFERLNKAVAKLIDDFSMVSFLQLDVQNEDSVDGILSYIDECIQFHEAREPTEPMDELGPED